MKTSLTLKQLKALNLFNHTVRQSNVLTECLDQMQLDAINSNCSVELRKIKRSYTACNRLRTVNTKVINKLYVSILQPLNNTKIDETFNSVFDNSSRHHKFINE